MSFWQSVKDLFKDDPIYVPVKTDAHVEGWKIAYKQQEDRAKIAERRLEMLRVYSESLIHYGYNAQYGYDIKAILTMTEAELDEDYGQD